MTKVLRIALATFAVFFSTTMLNAKASQTLTLADGGRSDYSIILPDAATETQRTAAKELQTFFQEVTDVKLPILTESEVPTDADLESFSGAKFFIIGPGPLSQRALKEIDESSVGYDGVILKNVGDSIVLSGAPLRGALYAVYEFLETKLGCRWWTSTESTIPKSPSLKIDANLDVFYAPKLIYRESYYRDAFDGIFAARSKCNGNGERVPKEYGGHHVFQYFVHSSFPLIPPQKYFLDHPDWFSEIDGVRKVGYPSWAGPSNEYREFEAKLKPEQKSASGTQLCFSNDEMIAEMVKNAREALHRNPDASFLSISQNDWHGYCTCEKCRAIDEEDGSHAGSLLRGVNKVAEALEDEFPNLYIETLAYQYTRKPPKVTRPRHNVIVRLCSIECSFSQPLDSEMNNTFREDLTGWSQIADNLFVWDYATDFAFYLLPFPNYRVIAPNLNFYVNHHVIGFFEQGDYQCETGDFVQLRNWVVSKLLWDPSLDPEALRDEFVAGYYAPELVPIYRDYFNALSDAVESKNYYLGIYKTDTTGWLDYDTLGKVTKLQKQALEIATQLERQNPEKRRGLVSKVRREQIPLDLVWLQEYRKAKLVSKLQGTEFTGPDDPLQAARDFVAKLDEFGLTKKREGESPEAFALFKQDLVASYEGYDPNEEEKAPEICANLPKSSWIVLQEYDFSKSRQGEWTFVVDDPSASNGRALMMPGNHYEWASGWSLSEALHFLQPVESTSSSESKPQFHFYVYARCNASAEDGPAMTMGIYDHAERKEIQHRSFTVEELKGDDYKLVDVGTTSGNSSEQLWFAPPKRPGEVDSVYVDRVIVVREK